MIQEQKFVTSTGFRRDTRQRAASSLFLSSLLVGIGITLVLTLIEVIIFWLVNPLHVPGSIASSLSALLALVMQSPSFLLIPLGELIVITFAVLLAAKPLALFAYLRAVHSVQEKYHRLYTPLKALTNVRQELEDYPQDIIAPTAIVAEEQISILDFLQQQDAHQFILGVPGAGKTITLCAYQYISTQQSLALSSSRGRISVYVPMKNYSLFLKQQEHISAENAQQVTLLDFLYESDLPDMRHLRRYLPGLSREGRLLLLCDGLNEVDSDYLARVSEELLWWMRDTRNRLVVTCCEVDYREQQGFAQLVDEGRATRAVISPLQPDQINELVERYVERQDKHWQHTAGQIMQVIDRSRLRYHCTNPLMLFTLMEIIDKIGVERGKRSDTRGRLLREYVKQLIEHEQRQGKWNRGGPAEQEVIPFLSEIACAARWANDSNAIQLRVSVPALASERGRGKANFDELADALQAWLNEHPAKGPFAEENDAEALSVAYNDLPQLLQCAVSAALIEISPAGVLSFRHELIAEYFVAEYFFAAAEKTGSSSLPFREELLRNVECWSEPIALWAGLLDDPLVLAERFGVVGRSNSAYVLQALALGLVCIGVAWTPPQVEVRRSVVLPPAIGEDLSIAVRNKVAREELARIFIRCAEEGAQEIYHSLLPIIMVDGVDELLILLDQSKVSELLFTQLKDTVDNVAYEVQIKRLTRVLGRFGGVVVDSAALLCRPFPGRSLRLRAASINILGGTNDARAVEPLIARLGDAEPFIVERTMNALIRLGPELTLTSVLQELEKRTPGNFTPRIHRAVLLILGRFLDEQDVRRQISLMQYQHVLETIVPVLTANYQTEPEVQLYAREMLVKQARDTMGAAARDNRWERVIEALIRYLPSQNEVAARNVVLALQEIGPAAMPGLLDLLGQPSDILRMRVVEILRAVRDPRALPRLLRLLSDSSPAVQQQVANALLMYAPESIPGLIDTVLTNTSDVVAERAAHILSDIGEPAVEPVTNVLFRIVPGRTRLLVQVLAYIHDPRSIPALVTLLQTPQIEPLLAVGVVRALSQFPEKRVVPPLLTVLSSTNPQLYEEAIDALSQLGEVALDGLIAALDAQEDSLPVQRVRRALLGMVPFPAEQLVAALGTCSDTQAQQIMVVFKMQGTDAALVLARHLVHQDERVSHYTQQTLSEMPGPTAVPALLEVLGVPVLRRIASTMLLKYPESAVSPLVELLGEDERGDAAALILPQFGPNILRPLISGLDDPRSMARELAQRIIVTLVRQSQDRQAILREIVLLFNPTPPVRARETLLRVLTSELADVSTPALLEGLEDAYLIEDVAEAFVLLMRKAALQSGVLQNLLQALAVEERRRGAETALIKIGAPAVPLVGELLTAPDPAVAKVAQHILREIGVPALSFIWMAHSDRNNPARRAAAMEVFHSMRTDVIKDELVSLLVSSKPEDMAMAVSLLLERIHDEATQHYADHEMIPVLIEYVQTHGVEETNLRIIALLLMLGEHAITDHFIQILDEYPQHREQLIHVLLLLGEETQEALLGVFNDPGASVELRAEIASVLGMTTAPNIVAEYAQKSSAYGLSANRAAPLFPEQLAISLRALGGLLAGGRWNAHKLQELRDASTTGSPAHELFNVLLGLRYEPLLADLESTIQAERQAHEKEIRALSARIVADQQRIQALDNELSQVRREHGFRGDELEQAVHDNQGLRDNLERATKERAGLRNDLEQLIQEKEALSDSLEQMTQERKILNARLEQALEQNRMLSDQNERLIRQMN